MIVLDLDSGRGGAGFVRRLADTELWTAAPLGPAPRPSPRPARSPLVLDARWTTVYDGVGLDLGALRHVVAELGEGGQRRVAYESGERFVVGADGATILLEPGPGGERPAVGASLERGLGAPLALALAGRGVHLLHASAIAGPKGVVALTADSGVGKSTFAAAVAALGPVWSRVADDQLSVRLAAEPLALPHFPQLKLDPAAEVPAESPAALPLVALVELERKDADARVVLERASPAAAALALARATTAARLFDPELLTLHLAACAAAAPALAVARLRYPSGRERLPELLGDLVDRLGAAG